MRVAVLGLGRMGAPIARRLEAAGHELFVWNRSPGAAAEFAGRGVPVLAAPAEALQRAEACIVMLADPAALEAVALGPDGILAHADGGTLIDMSTVSPEVSTKVAAEAERLGVAFLRSPVSGNPSVVEAGNLAIIVSGPRATFDELTPLFLDIGPKLFYVGPDEQARIVKLALNLMILGTTQLLAEALVLSEQYGVDRREMLEVMGGSAIGSPFVKYKTDALVADNYASTFTAELAAKDLTLALAAGDARGVPLEVTALTLELMRDCVAAGMGGDDMTALLPNLRRKAGLET
jgi:3-hydroxyisobutyrate dehydrogenase-like beta-hydroxyacid dehydrogenase